MLTLLLILPVALCLVSLAFRRRALNRLLLAGFAVAYAAGAVLVLANVSVNILPDVIRQYFNFDSLGKLFLLVLAAVNLGVSFYSVFYLKHKNLSRKQDTIYTIFMLLFLVSMTGGVLTTHLGLLWVFIEATTLAGGMLISVEQGKQALEAVWKYIFICSIGVAFSFIGIIVLSLGSKAVGSLSFADLYSGASAINPLLLKLSFAFILVGFGTKMGLAPVHAWLPDAHAEAPSPVSALLSGALLNIAGIGLIRFYPVMTGAGLQPFAGTLVLVMGFLSLLVSAAFILTAKNYKRMLAYSSIENMGIVAVGLGLGGPGVFAALLHMVVHSLAKSGLFLTTGNILHLTGTKQIGKVQGLLKRDGKTAWLWILGFVAIAGLPPFGVFFSKYFMVSALVFLLLVVFAFGMGKAVFSMAWGETLPAAAGEAQTSPARLPVWAYLPSAFFLVLLIALGLFIPDFITTLLNDVTKLFAAVGGKR
jgi:hydrogenase-4 component F